MIHSRKIINILFYFSIINWKKWQIINEWQNIFGYEISAQKLGLPLLSAYLDSVGTNFSHGANFATAGSTVRPQNTTLRQGGFSPISLDVQFVEFCEFQTRTQTFRAQSKITILSNLLSFAFFNFTIFLIWGFNM